MGIASQEPDPGRNGPVARWVYHATPNGSTTCGYLAGQPFGTFVHHEGKSLPCRLRITDGQLSCPYCAMNKAPDWRGYLPFYTKQFVRSFVLIAADMLTYVRTLQRGDQVKFIRKAAKQSPLVVVAETWTPKLLPPGDGRDTDASIADFIIGVVWKDLELRRWHVSAASSDTPPSPVNRIGGVPSGGMVPKRAALPDDQIARLKRFAEEQASILDTAGIGLPMPQPSSNGTHRPRKPK